MGSPEDAPDFYANRIRLLRDQLLQTGTTLNLFNLYSVFGIILGAVPILLALYSLLTVILWPMIYREYRHKQIA